MSAPRSNVIKKYVVRKNEYHDSVFLLRLSEKIQNMDGVSKAAVVMSTDNNKNLLKEIDLFSNEVKGSGPNDLVIAFEAREEVSDDVMLKVDEFFKEKIKAIEEFAAPKSLEMALDVLPDANLAFISVPGQFAYFEVKKALENGLNVFLFSDNVPIEDEIELKKIAVEKGVLLMGPEAGTAIINGVALGFANVVGRGPIGVVGAVGTGIQEITSIISREMGVSQAIGTGGRDLYDQIGGNMMERGIKVLELDKETEVIVVVAKSPSKEVQRKVLKVVEKCVKPVVVNFIGGKTSLISSFGAIPALTLEDAAMKALNIMKGEELKDVIFSDTIDKIFSIAEAEYQKLISSQKYVRGLFSGGTFCNEAMLIMGRWLGEIYSNIPLISEVKLDDPNSSKDNTCIDMGSDEFTIGRPHPIIDLTMRRLRLLKEALDPETAVILLDVVLGYGAHQDPAGVLASNVAEAKGIAEKGGRHLSVVASICGTEDDPQNLEVQKKKLEESGVIVMPSNAQASRMATLIVTRGQVKMGGLIDG